MPNQAQHHPFISSMMYNGSKEGYIFKNDIHGVGYYCDTLANNDCKRKRDDNDVDGIDCKVIRKQLYDPSSSSASAASSIQKLLDESDKIYDSNMEVTSNNIEQLLFAFEKKISKNQLMRVKYPNEPMKFMESEIELAVEIQKLAAVAMNPELYSILIQAGSVSSILGMIAHENTDISAATIKLVEEITSPKVTDSEDKIEDQSFINTFINGQGLELIVQNLFRLDELIETDAECIHTTLNIIENLIQSKPDVVIFICEKTHIFKYLLSKILSSSFNANKLYSSEILSMLLQADSKAVSLLCNLSDTNGVDVILQSIAVYRKVDPCNLEEKECIENLFLCLNTILADSCSSNSSSQQTFLQCDGLSLLMRCVKEKKYSSICSLSTINYAITSNVNTAQLLVNAGGLKYIFPALVGKGLPKVTCSNNKYDKNDVEVVIVSIISQLCMLLYDKNSNDYSLRIRNKFLENDHEKFDKILSLYLKYRKQLAITEHHIQVTAAELAAADDVDAYDEYTDEDNVYLQRLDGGLFVLQQLSVIISFVLVYDGSSCMPLAVNRLATDASDLSEIIEIVREMTDNLGNDSSSNSSKDTLVSLTAVLVDLIKCDAVTAVDGNSNSNGSSNSNMNIG